MPFCIVRNIYITSLTRNTLSMGKVEAGEAASRKCGVGFLAGDYKKKDGYRRSIELSREYGLYRQDWCGCGFSKAESEARRAAKAASAGTAAAASEAGEARP